VPPLADQAAPLSLLRTDLKLFAAEEQTAARIVRDSSKDYWPTIDALFSPSTTHPAQFFLPANSWRFLLLGNVPIFDSGQRAGTRIQREAAVEEARATLAGATTRAGAEVRAAREAVASRRTHAGDCASGGGRSAPDPQHHQRQLPRRGGDQHRGHRCRARLA
jgi:outer membrane protein TolC